MQQNIFNNQQYSPHNNNYPNMMYSQEITNNQQAASINQLYPNRHNSVSNGNNMLSNFYNNQHLNGTAIIDDDDLNYQNNNFYQFRHNSMSYNQNRPSQGFNFDNYNMTQQNNQFLRPNSFSQQSTASSGSNNPNFNYSRMSSFSNSDAQMAFNDQPPMYNRASFGSNFSNQQTNLNIRNNSATFISDYNNTLSSASTINEPIVQSNFNLNNLPSISSPPQSNNVLNSRKTSTTSTTSTHSNHSSNIKNNIRRPSKSHTSEKKNSISKDSSLKDDGSCTIQAQKVIKDKPVEVKKTISSKTSDASEGNSAAPVQIPTITMKKQEQLLNKIKGNGLINNETSNKQEVSKELQALHDQSGKNYFAEDSVFHFVNCLKAKLKKDYLKNINGNNKFNKFMKYLFACNDQFVSDHVNSNYDIFKDTSPFVSSQGKSFCLVALKNGKLELLSVSKHFTSSYTLKPRNLVIIDGDRGIDLAMVVEPQMSFMLSLLVNFLKKKIHFDSLITDPRKHHPNKEFIDALLERHTHVLGTKPLNNIIDTKLYDLQELTQLIIPSKQVVRFASPKDCTTSLLQKLQEELKSLNFVLSKLDSYNEQNSQEGKGNKLNIKILNSEYQFDRKKLTFYYTCQERNDYRELIKELFRFYKTRIWLCAIPNNLGIIENGEWFNGSEKSLINGHSEVNKKKNTINFDDVVLDQFQIAVYIELLKQLF
ncbi:hypothetical protein ACO0R3_001300 [Hanseniaspora guilliermondii]